VDYRTFHNYNRLVRRGQAKPICCGMCGNEYTLRLGKNDEPELQCFYCDVRVKPGLRITGDVEAVVKEHYL
jgi:hypothetical protein